MIAVALFYCALTVLLAFPLSIHPGDTVMSPGVDTNLFIWTLAWNAHALAHQPATWFQANIFHPLPDSLAFSENLIGSSVIATPILWLGGSPVLAMNSVALVSIPASALGAFVLARQLGASLPAAFLGGVVFGFAPPRFFRLDQLHLTLIEWIPFCLAFAHRYLQRGRPRDLRLAIAFFTAQALNSGHGAVFLAVALALLAGYAIASGTSISAVRRVRDLGLAGIVLLVPAVLVLLPYRRVQDEIGLVRTLADYRVVSWQSFLASPSYVHRWIVDTFLPDWQVIGRAGAYLFPGILPIVLAVVALVPRRQSGKPESPGRVGAIAALLFECLAVAALALAAWTTAAGPLRWRVGEATVLTIRGASRPMAIAALSMLARLALLRRIPFAPRRNARSLLDAIASIRRAAAGNIAIFYGTLTVMCVWLSIAPPLGLWPFVYWLPGFNFIRAPSRFMILGTLGVAMLSAIGFDRLLRGHTPGARSFAAFGLAVLMATEFAAFPLGVARDSASIPAIDRWLAGSHSVRAIAEAPVIEAISEHDMQNSQFMRHSMAHWQKTVHGYSGVHPPLTDGLYEHLIQFPAEETIRALKSVGVDTVVVHMDAYPPDARQDIERRLTSQPGLRLEHVEGDGRIYSLR